jgi:hypothetical protein
MEHDKVRDMVMIARDELAEAHEQSAAMREAIRELQNIADAKPSTWGEMADQFKPWAQNRARHALAKLQPFLAQ